MSKTASLWAIAILGVAPLGIFCASLFVHPITQDPTYHVFADQRRMLGIPNFWNVIPNAAFLMVAAFGARTIRSISVLTQDWEQIAFITLLAGATPDLCSLYRERRSLRSGSISLHFLIGLAPIWRLAQH